MQKQTEFPNFTSRKVIFFYLVGCFLVACGTTEPTAVPTRAGVTEVLAPTVTLMGETAVSANPIPPTWTPPPFILGVESNNPNQPVAGVPTYTPFPIATYTAVPPRPSATAVIPTTDPATLPSATPLGLATTPPNQTSGPNLLPNPSFEEGWYHPNNIPELQIPNSWAFEWEEGPTGFGNQTWDVWVRPEVRVLEDIQLPAAERPLFIYEGDYTVKVFKGYGAISYRLTTLLNLTPGTYRLKVNLYPDLIMGYTGDGQKIWADDPLSGDVKLLAGATETGWMLPTFGQKNSYTLIFTVSQPQTMMVGVAIRGRFAINNNGWFLDNFSLHRLGG